MNLCNLCPNNCNIDRDNKVGFCGELNKIKIAKYYLHPFEEPCISSKNGSGTIFFTGCSLKCVFCQNYDLSRSSRGIEISTSKLVDIFKELEDKGATNINLVTPTHFVTLIADALNIYKPNIPIVYNTHSYENLSTIKFIEPYVDIFLPDLKFYSPLVSKRYTFKENYFLVASKNILYMMDKKQTVIENDVMKSGVIVRHLILPMNTNDSVKIVNWFKENAKNNAYLSLMSQYTPFGKIEGYEELKRRITKKEYERVLNEVYNLNIENCFIQELDSAKTLYIPKWDY